MRAMFGARPVWGGFQTREAEDKSDELIVREGTEQKTTVMNRSDKDMGRHHIRFAIRPDGALKSFDSGHFLRCLENFYYGNSHGLTRDAEAFLNLFRDASVPGIARQIIQAVGKTR